MGRFANLLLISAVLTAAPSAYGQATPDIPEEEEVKAPPPPPPSDEPPPPAAPPPSAPPPPAVAKKPEVKATTTKEDERPTAGRLAVSPSGETGLYRLVAAESMDPGLIRLSFGLDFFAINSFIEKDDGHASIGGTLAVSASPIDYLELWLNFRAQSNSNNLTQPNLLQSLGDWTLGIKGFYPVAKLATIGVDVQAIFLSGIGSASWDFGATNLWVRALLTSDLYRATEKIPVRLHLNLGFLLDNSDHLIGEGAELTNAERFALGISDFNRVTLGAGIEVPVKYVTLFLEYTAEFPTGYLATPGIVVTENALRPAQALPDCDTNPFPCEANNVARPAYQRVVPQRITPGVRITAIPKLTLDLVAEIGITPDVGTGVLAVPPYKIALLASYPLDPFGETEQRGPPISVPVIVPEAVEAAPEAGKVGGLVKNKADGTTLSGAIIRFDRAPPVATSPDGRFTSHELAPGPVSMTVEKDGFQAATANLEVSAGDTAELDVELVPLVREGLFKGRVVDEKDKPLAGISVSIDGPSQQEATTDDRGEFEAKANAGRYTITVEQEGYLRKSRVHQLEGGETYTADFLIRKPPKEKLVEVTGDRILVKRSVHFITGEARLAPDAASLLDNVVDVLVEKPTIRVRVEGHTDNVGNDESNLQLSKDRAQAVVRYLVEQGIDAARLSGEGFGSSRPIAPNLTRRGREQNRRVEFVIVEQ
jgi:OmpA-OmpF porin, OOP family